MDPGLLELGSDEVAGALRSLLPSGDAAIPLLREALAEGDRCVARTGARLLSRRRQSGVPILLSALSSA